MSEAGRGEGSEQEPDGGDVQRRVADAASPRPEAPPRNAAEIAAAQLSKPPVGHALERAQVLESAPAFLPVQAPPAETPEARQATADPVDTSPSQAFDPAAPMISVVLEFLGAMRDLPALGALPVGRAGHVVAAYANVASLGRLQEHPAVVRLEEGRPWALPVSRHGAEAPLSTPDVPAENGEASHDVNGGSATGSSASSPASLTGRNVRLAILDLGFDFLHPALMTVGATPQPRALWLQDFGLPSQAGSVRPGRRFDRSDLRAALKWWQGADPSKPRPRALAHLKRLSTASDGTAHERELMERHGTAVAGIAAGTAPSAATSAAPTGAVDAMVAGVAPDADLALIAIAGSGEAGRFSDSTDMLAGFALAFDACPQPCVAVMANSDNLGPHDGTLAGERFLEELLVLPGRAIVVTVGNLNHGVERLVAGRRAPAFHAVVDPPGEAAETLDLQIHDAVLSLEFDDGCIAADVAEIWFHAPAGGAVPAGMLTASVAAALFDDTDPVAVAPLAIPLAAPDPVVVLDTDKGGGGTVSATLADDPAAGARCLRLAFTPPPDGEMLHGRWTITVTAQGPVHGWLTRNNQGRGRWRDTPAQQGANHVTLGSPACAARVLSVGSVKPDGSTPSDFSGRGPVRHGAQKKPDLVAVGEGIRGPLGSPAERSDAEQPAGPGYIVLDPGGTSYAAPQVAGACALLFEHFGPAATWADLRQVLLESARRTGAMPSADAEGWDPACGHGLLDLPNLLARPTPPTDLWLASAPGDDGFEPFVDWTFWASPDIVAEDAAGQALTPAAIARGDAEPAQVRVRVRNRGTGAGTEATVSLHWSPLGVLHPLPGHPTLVSPWQETGLGPAVTLATVPLGGVVDAVFSYVPPRAADASVLPHMLLATVNHSERRFDPTEPLSARNNAAAISVAAAGSDRDPPAFTLLGSPDSDGAIVWLEGADGVGLVIESLPVAALPWRDAGLFVRQGWRGRRPRWGDKPADPAAHPSEDRVLATPEEIEEVTDIQGATRVTLSAGRVRIEGGGRLTLPRLRLALGTPLALRAVPTSPVQEGALHMLHLSGGRRAGGGTVILGG